MADAAGVPPASTVSAADAHDVTGLLPTAAACPLAGYSPPAARPGGSGTGRTARPGVAHRSGLGRQRYVVEQTSAAIHQNRRLKVRYERRPDTHQAFLTLAGVKVCWHRLAGRFR